MRPASHSNLHSLRLTSFLSAVENEREGEKRGRGREVKRDWCMISNYTPIRRAFHASSLHSRFLPRLFFSPRKDNSRHFSGGKKENYAARWRAWRRHRAKHNGLPLYRRQRHRDSPQAPRKRLGVTRDALLNALLKCAALSRNTRRTHSRASS